MRNRKLTREQIWQEAAKGQFGEEHIRAIKGLVANLIYIPLTDEEKEMGIENVPPNWGTSWL